MKIKTPFFYIKVDILFIIVLFIFFLSSFIRTRISSFFICYLFIVFHELAHMLLGSILGREVDVFNIGMFGVNISFKDAHYEVCKKDKNNKEIIKNIVIYLAGPISNFILAIIFNKIKLIFDINIFLGVLNLIPIYPLDGYNILYNILCLYKKFKNKEKEIINIINFIFFIILNLCGIILIIIYFNPSLFIFSIYLILLKNTSKIPKNYI